MVEILKDSPDLDWLVRKLIERLDQGDIQDCIAGTLTVAGRHSGTSQVHEDASRALVRAGKWGFAAAVDTPTAVKALRERLRAGQTDFPTDLWWRLYKARAEGLEQLLVEAADSGVADPEVGALSTWLRLASSTWGGISYQVDTLIEAEASPPWYLEPLPEPMLTAVTDVLADRLAALGRQPRLSLVRAYEIWSLAVGDRLVYTKQLPVDRRLRLAVLLGRKHDNMDHDMMDVRHLMIEPLANEDAIRWGGRLAEQGFHVPAQDSDIDMIAKRFGDLEWAGETPTLVEPITEAGASLALALVAEAATRVGPLTTNQAESLLWALAVLYRQPTIDALRDLWMLDRHRDAHTAGTLTDTRPFHWLDSVFLSRVLWGQPWQERAMSIRHFPTDDPAWDSTVLMAAADIATFPHAQNPKLSRLEAIDYYATGLTLWSGLRAGERPALEEYAYLELTSFEECVELSDRVLPLAAGADRPTKAALIDNLASSIHSAGRLPEFFDSLRWIRHSGGGAAPS